MVEVYAFEEILGFCIKYLQDFTTTWHRVCDEKEYQTMFDEMFEGNGCACVMNANFWDMAHSFVFQNLELMDRCHR
jgi:hypothetical protein